MDDYMSPGCLGSDDAEYDDQNGFSDSHPGASPDIEPSSKSKKILKVCRHFSYNLIDGAVEAGWEGHELANLIKLVSCQLSLDGSKLIKLLERTGTGTPDIVCQLMEQQHPQGSSSASRCCSFSTPQLVAVFLSTAKNIEHFINIMEQAFEYDLFSLSSPDTLEVLHSFTVDAMDYRQTQRYARAICEHCGSKASCGRVLRQFSSSLPAREAPHFVFEVISLDFFRDLSGTMQQFLKEVGVGSCVGEAVDGLLSEAHDRDDDGEIVESDADSHGDLKDFIAPDDESNGQLDADSEAESVNGSNDDDDASHGEEQRGRVQREDLQQQQQPSTTIARKRRKKEEGSQLCPHRAAATATAAAPPSTKRRRLLSNSNRTQSPDSADEDDVL